MIILETIFYYGVYYESKSTFAADGDGGCHDPCRLKNNTLVTKAIWFL